MLKEFQRRTLDRVTEYLRLLAQWREKARDLDPELGVDWTERAWETAATGRPYFPRKDGLGRPLPTFCLKIPTGGGKTLLATKIIDLVNMHFDRRQTGLVLWIVPTTQIYDQTRRALRDRAHPYRQLLDVASAGRTLILEKKNAFRPSQVAENLCILLLMLPSANRKTKGTLRMFHDSGGFSRFFPSDGAIREHSALRQRVPNLDIFEKSAAYWEGQVKTSLGNTLRLLEPLIILDEGHKAYGSLARETLEGFNPRMIVELSATPAKEANVLVEVSGQALNAEEMIKLDLHIQNKSSVSWQDTLLAAVEQRQRLEEQALSYEASSGTYIRPICLVQVERTGREQRKAGFIHAEDVREYLLRHPTITAEQVAVKTSASDELKEVDEVGGLMSRNCPIRFIITKQALQEGWDCAFAYVLAILTNPSSKSALTQLVGRILRQPNARKTRVAALDESYVFCFQQNARDLLDQVRKGFGREGLDDLSSRIRTDDGETPQPGRVVKAKPRDRFRPALREFVLPAFVIRDGRRWRPVHHEMDILSRVRWDEVDLTPLFDLELGQQSGDQILHAGLDTERVTTAPSSTSVNSGEGGDGVLSYYFAANHLIEVMPNPWRAAEAARRVVEALLKRRSREQVAANSSFILEELRRHLALERDRLSRNVFSELLDSGVMRFMVVAKDFEFHRLPPEIEYPATERQANREDGSPFHRNLFDRTSESDLNGLEQSVAAYLDGQQQLFFWYRNRARKDFFVQGWRPHRIYADFIFTLEADEPGTDDEFHRVFVVETKGVHLKDSDDTAYKRSVFDLCSRHARRADWAKFVPAMRNKVVRFEVVDQDQWKRRLNALLETDP